MATYKVVLEIEVDADTPLEAAKTTQNWIQDPDFSWQYYIQEEGAKKIHVIDLLNNEEPVLEVLNYKPLIQKS